MLSVQGLANILMFRETAGNVEKVHDKVDEDTNLRKLSEKIISEIKSIKNDSDRYKRRIDKTIVEENVSKTLTSLLSSIGHKLDSTPPAFLIGNIVIGIVTNKPTDLQIALGVLVREKQLLENLHDFGVTCAYDEVLRFKTSGAASTAEERDSNGIFQADDGLVQAVADNFDANICSQNGLQSTHALAMLMTQMAQTTITGRYDDNTIRKLVKTELSNAISPDVPVQCYNGPKKPTMLPDKAIHQVLPSKVLAQQSISVHIAQTLDFSFLNYVAKTPLPTEYGGF